MNEEKASSVKYPRKTRNTKRPRRRLTVKQKLFAEKYIENKGNGTKSALEVYDTKDYATAGAIATENLNKPLIRKEIAHLASLAGLELNDVLKIHKRNMNQADNLAVSQTAVRDYYTIVGLNTTKDTMPNVQVNVGVVHIPQELQRDVKGGEDGLKKTE